MSHLPATSIVDVSKERIEYEKPVMGAKERVTVE